MTQAQHTPGPWHVVDLGLEHGTWVSATAEGYGIRGDGSHYMQVCASAIGEANARLIAAAPELLAAAKLFVAYDAATDDDHVAMMLNYADALEAAIAAIAKAEGRND
jgi:hypothetical protein